VKKKIIFIILITMFFIQYSQSEVLYKGDKSECMTKDGFQLQIPIMPIRSSNSDMTTTGIIDLPIWGGYFQMAVDEVSGDVWLLYHEGGEYTESPVSLFNCHTMERIAVPDAKVKWGLLRSGIAARDGIIHVAWSPDNQHIMYRSFNTVSRTWTGQEQIYQDQEYPSVPDADTGNCSLAVSSNGTVMCVFASDFKMQSRFKSPGQGWSGIQEVAPYHTNEPRCPSVQSNGNGFTVSYTAVFHADRGSVATSYWNGNWSRDPYYCNDVGSSWPDSASCFVDPNGNNYTAWILWEGSTQKYSRIGFGQKVNGQWSQNTWSIVSVGGDIEHPPMTPVAVDAEGNIVAGYFNFVSSDKRTFLKIKEKGKDWVTLQKGEDSHIAVTYNPTNKYFYSVYINGTLKLETFSFESQVEPTPTPTPSTPEDNIPLWDVFEVELYTSKNYGNPFTDETLFGWFAEPGTSLPSNECNGDCHAVEGVYDGIENGKHKFLLRFRPDIKGEWTYATFSATGNTDLRIANKKLTVVEPRENNHGPMHRDGKYIWHADGTAHQHLGGTSFGLLWRGPYLQYLQKNIDQGVTYFRIGLLIAWGEGCSSQGGWEGCCGDGYRNGCWLGLSPFETWFFPPTQNIDWARMNIGLFQKLDEVMNYLLERGCYAELLIYDASINYCLREYGSEYGYVKDDGRQTHYLKYLAKRYKAYPHFWYELGNEIRHSTPITQMAPSQEWVIWVFNTLSSIDPERLLAYEAPGASAYGDPQWDWNPSFHYDWFHTIEQGSHKVILEQFADIINIHTARGYEWWSAGPMQMEYLSDTFGKPVNNDEPHRKGYYGIPCEDWQIRRSAWRTAFVGNAYYTIHGVSLGDFCRACLEDSDLGAGMSNHFTKFWDKIGTYNFERDNSLIEGSGSARRCMHRDSIYVYYEEDGFGWVRLKTHHNKTYEMYVMDTSTGEVIEEKIKDSQNPTVFIGDFKRDYAAFLRPYTPPTPTPTPTPKPTPTPGNGGGPGCGCAHFAFASEGEWTVADEAMEIGPTFLTIIVLVIVTGYLRRYL